MVVVPYLRGYGTTRFPPAEQFVTAYSGKVVANLASPDGSRMRCRFHLARPSAGMAGGGQGECQLLGDGTIEAVFNPT